LALFSTLSLAQADIPEAKVSQGIEFISGGIGSEESDAMLALGKKWPLVLEFSQDHPQRPLWVADVTVKILDQKKKVVFEALSEGPIMLLKMNPGKYDAEYSFEGKVLKRTLVVEEGKFQKQSVVWPR
jgi:fructose-bisphosphate aldolase class 1